MTEKTRKTAYLGIFAGLAIIFGYVETLIPVFVGVPGIKLGLANLAVLFILQRYTFREAVFVSVIRIIVIGFMFGNMFSIIYSLAGAALSLSLMSILKNKTDSSLIFISIIGGISHNVGQLIVAMFVLESTALFYYAPVLLISGVVTGILIGILTTETAKRIRL